MNFRRIFAFVYIPIIIINLFFTSAYGAVLELPVDIYYGWSQADAAYRNVDFKDVAVLDDAHWAKSLIYEMAILDVFKGYGDKTFRNNEYVSKEQAIALMYRLTGGEERTQKAGEELEKARLDDDKLSDALSIWSDGYLKIASQEGLITQDDFSDALESDQSFVQFRRTDSASREEIARWIVMALGAESTYPQNAVFNNFKDWKEADPLKVPYIESALQMGIMNGTGDGYFYPNRGISRQEMAQVLKNALGYVFPKLKFQRSFGVIEAIKQANVYKADGLVQTKTFDLRMSSGKLHEMVINYRVNAISDNNENIMSGEPISMGEDIIVYKNGRIGKSAMLEEGDSLEFVSDENKTVRYVRVIESYAKPELIAAKVKSVDVENRYITVEWLGNVPGPVYSGIPMYTDDAIPGFGKTVVYNVSANAGIVIGEKMSDLAQITSGMSVVLTMRANVVCSIVTAIFNVATDKNVFVGIVEENNPILGYISLYSEDGSINSERYRIFYYNNNDIEALRDNRHVSVGDVMTGDTAFIRLNDDGAVISISARNNYIPKYATIISKNLNIVNVEYDDGTQQVFKINPDILVISDKRISSFDRVNDGDRVKLILNEQDGTDGLKQMTIESSGHYISNIYRVSLSYIDDITGKLVCQEAEKLEGSRWVKEDAKGNFIMKIWDQCRIMYQDKTIGIETINKHMKDYGAYIAAEKVPGGEERAVFITIRSDADREFTPYKDSIAAVYEGTKDVSIVRSTDSFKYGDGTIIVKNGRMVRGNNIMPDDPVLLVANRHESNGSLVAKVINITNKKQTDSLFVYRGRIVDINDNTNFTVETYAMFDGLSWKVTTAPKTFEISYRTRILGDDGPVSIRDFVAYGDDSYKGKTIYIAEKDSLSILLSTAPHAIYSFKGEVSSVDLDDTTNIAVGFTLFRAKFYDATLRKWVSSENVHVTLPVNGVVFENNDISSISAIRKGSTVRIVKSDQNLTGEGYLIFIEN